LDNDTKNKVTQIKLNALAAKHLHVKCRETFNTYNQNVDFLGIAVPTFYFAFRYLAKSTQYEGLVEGVWGILAAILAVATIAKMVYHWPDKAQRHSELLGENISLVGQANDLLREENISQESLRLFSLLDEKLEREDLSLLGRIDDEDRQMAYRSALKELNPGDISVVCPSCKSSPWRFTAGSCQVCGNTPAIQRPDA
jgi:mobilome CxxCx(11)CxxC protein